MVDWQLIYTKQADRDSKKISKTQLRPKVEELLKIFSKNPYQTPPSFEKLGGNLEGAYSRRINIQHRLIYQVLKEQKIVKIIRLWTHYE